MTVSPNRATEILAAYGADPDRWPDAERAQCLALIERLPGLGYERRLAAALDVALVGWAREPAVARDGDGEADRAVARAMAVLPAPPRARAFAWMGGALAASVAAGLAFVTLRPGAPAPVAASPAITQAQAQADSAQFRAVFAPTPDEEDVLS